MLLHVLFLYMCLFVNAIFILNMNTFTHKFIHTQINFHIKLFYSNIITKNTSCSHLYDAEY